ncbi:MAG: hypothetical protein PHT40_04545 [Patescibacteria group bacterium]|nr:hypothetical protein [Patescibacteria group bacterium]
MKKYLFILLFFLVSGVWSQNSVLQPKPDTSAVPDSLLAPRVLSARDSVLARAKEGFKQRLNFGCQADTTFIVPGNSQRFGYVPDEIPKFIAWINSTKELYLEVERLDEAFFSHRDTQNGLWGRFFVSHRPDTIIVYSEGKYQPKKGFASKKVGRGAAKIMAALGIIDFPIKGQAFLVLTYAQQGDSVVCNFKIHLETGHDFTNNAVNKLLRDKYKPVAAKALYVAFKQILAEPDSLILP